MGWLGLEKMKQHWRYVVARYGALPCVWCAAGETTMPYYLSKDKGGDSQRQRREWTELAATIHKIDPFRRPVTLHGAMRVSSRQSVTDASVADFELLQTGHGSREVVAATADLVRGTYREDPPIPVVNGEPAYEHLRGQNNSDACRMIFWSCLLNGAAGYTYGANGIWQINRPDQPYGDSPSPSGGWNWGTIPWPEAMKLPGSKYISLGANLLREFPWHRCAPHREWASWEEPAENEREQPYAAGIPGELRIIYSLEPKPLLVHGLESNQRYIAMHFDPATGCRNKLGPVEADTSGQWRCPAPNRQHDWVLILQKE